MMCHALVTTIVIAHQRTIYASRQWWNDPVSFRQRPAEQQVRLPLLACDRALGETIYHGVVAVSSAKAIKSASPGF